MIFAPDPGQLGVAIKYVRLGPLARLGATSLAGYLFAGSPTNLNIPASLVSGRPRWLLGGLTGLHDRASDRPACRAIKFLRSLRFLRSPT